MPAKRKPEPEHAQPSSTGEVTDAEVEEMEQVALGAGHPVELTVEEVEEHRADTDT